MRTKEERRYSFGITNERKRLISDVRTIDPYCPYRKDENGSIRYRWKKSGKGKWLKRQASKKTRRSRYTMRKGNAYRKVFDLKWMLY